MRRRTRGWSVFPGAGFVRGCGVGFGVAWRGFGVRGLRGVSGVVCVGFGLWLLWVSLFPVPRRCSRQCA